MKIKRKRTNKKVRWLVGTLGALALFGGMTTWVLADKKEEKSTRASSEIILDAGTSQEFKVPVDATDLIEPKLKNDDKYKGYVQGEKYINNYSKENYFLQSISKLNEYYLDVIYIPERDHFLAYGIESSYQVGKAFSSNTFIAVLDSNGKEVKRNYFLGGPNYNNGINLVAETTDSLVRVGDKISVWVRLFEDKYESFIDLDGNIIDNVALDISNLSSYQVNRQFNFISITSNNAKFLTSSQYKNTFNNDPDMLKNKIVLSQLTSNNTVGNIVLLDSPDYTKLNDTWTDSSTAYYELITIEESDKYYIVQLATLTNEKIINHLLVWDKSGKLIKINTYNSGENYTILSKISDENNIYILGNNGNKSTMYKFNKDNANLEKIREFPLNANLNFSKQDKDTIQFYGVMDTYSDDFSGLAQGNNLVIGTLDSTKNMEVSSFNYIKFDSSTLSFNASVYSGDKIVLVGGMSGTSQDVSLVNPNGYINKQESSFGNAISFVLNQKPDYAPIIKTTNQTININKNLSNIESYLLAGVDAYDTYDLSIENVSGQKTQAWLDQRINRNPNKIVYESDNLTAKTLPDIDWKTLGYDKTKVGPQEVTYFVTDSQNQTTSTTRIINNVTNETTDNRKAQLDAHNFTIPLTNVQKGDLATDNAIKKKAKTVAWETDSGTAVEDASANVFNNDKVIFSNQSQVDAIRNATEAKPYPLDIQYKGSSKVTNRIWVFVTADNTVVQNGVVLYADDFKLPLKEAGSSTADNLLKKDKFKNTQPNVVAYDLTAQPQDVKTLPPLSEGKKDGTSKGLSMDTNSLQRIKGSTKGGILTGIIFTYTNPTDKKVTSVKVDVSIEDSAEFCFKLERTKEVLTFVDLTVDDSVNKNYRSMSIELPSFVKLTTVPSSWTRLPDQTTTSSGGATRNLYRFNMKSKNTVADIKTFLEGIKMTIASTNVNTPDTVKIYLHEEELLPDAKPKAISKDAVLKSSAVIETGDFGLYTESKWDDDAGRNYVDLQWDKVPNLSDNGYKMYQSVDGNTFEIRSIKYNKAIKVLNIYPDVPDSNTLKGWMDGLGLTDKEGNNLIQVTPVSITDYNADPDKYLKNSQGNYQYDVLMFGSWDGNAALDLNDNSYTATRKFTNTGRGVLFGHDAVHFLNKNFMRFSEDVGVFPLEYPFIDTPSSVQYWTGDDSVTVVNNGYLMKYPFEMEQNQILNIPYSHTIHPRNKHTTTVWLNFTGKSGEFIGGMEDENWINNWYLITKNNFSMTQMGHSNGASTHDERMITANTLYNLAQVGLEENGQDYTVKDDKAPDIVATPTRDMENNVTVEGVDFGKEYYHYVTADTKDKGLLKSDTVKTEVISDLQGYVYVVDENPTTIPNVTKDAYGKVTNITAPVTNPETDRSVTIGGFTKEGQYLHIIPVDRANNVGEVKHYKLGDLAYTEEPHQTSCQHNIPQKVYIKGKDKLGNALPEGDQVLETKLRNNKKFNFTPNTITNYDYVELKEKATGSVITPEVFTIGSTKQDAEAIYRRKSAKIHIRQQVLNSNKTVVVPTQGHASLLGTDALSTGTTKMTVPFNSSDKTDLDFTDYEIEIEDTKTLLSINDIVPMYYDLKGYVVTNTNKAHAEANMVKEINSIDLIANPEIWVTVYVEPNVVDAAFYGWMYGQDGQYTVSK